MEGKERAKRREGTLNKEVQKNTMCLVTVTICFPWRLNFVGDRGRKTELREFGARSEWPYQYLEYGAGITLLGNGDL